MYGYLGIVLHGNTENNIKRILPHCDLSESCTYESSDSDVIEVGVLYQNWGVNNTIMGSVR